MTHHRPRASIVVNAYTGALEELREEMQLSPFASWSTEQMQVILSRGMTIL